jgi:hypothetical protein
VAVTTNEKGQMMAWSSDPEYWQDWLADGEDADADFWWRGFCPMHDWDKEAPHSAEFNFNTGNWRCLGQPSCHAPKKGSTLTKLRQYVLDNTPL